jgi:hypothetical protein
MTLLKKAVLVLAVLLVIAVVVASRYAATERRGYSEDRDPSPETALVPEPVAESPPEGQVEPPAAAPEATKPPAAHVAEAVSVGETQGTQGTEVPSAEEAPALSPEQALETLKVMFQNYGQRFKGNPVGNNAEITAALNGNNPQGVHFLAPARDHMNDKGELVDGWGTPYFFHQLGGYDMEIHSAGPDLKMWTKDDLVTR